MNNEDRRRKAEMLGLVMMHCASQQAMYDEALKNNENGYQPKTNIFEILTLAETHSGGAEVVVVVSTILAGASTDALVDPVAALTDLVMAIKYKTKFYDPKDEPDCEPVKILNAIYNSSLDVVQDAIMSGKISSDISDKVCEIIYQ